MHLSNPTEPKRPAAALRPEATPHDKEISRFVTLYNEGLRRGGICKAMKITQANYAACLHSQEFKKERLAFFVRLYNEGHRQKGICKAMKLDTHEYGTYLEASGLEALRHSQELKEERLALFVRLYKEGHRHNGICKAMKMAY